MKQFLTVVAFTLLTIGFFSAYSNYGIPQIEPAPPPKEEKLDLGAMTMDQFIALGERIFNGKGTCTLCHNELGRAPMLGTLADVVPERLKDPLYKGAAEDLESYLIESLVEPSAFVVVGFGKKGTNDSESPMPNVAGGSIGLSEAEVAAVTAYLQDSSGAEVTVEIPTHVAEADEEEEAEEREALGDPAALMAKFTCDACHMINGQGGEVGPKLSKIGAEHDRDYLRRALLDPNADIAKGFEADMMPDDLGEQMYVTELEVLLDFLVALK
ncbi:MAG: c-type cytochrome [Rhodospirillaceae bacterium]|jgi:mono/diheme cytochrome c family protein|nr:c-type cytochrome [Rhodospirillaceae bacterium]MBT5192041.1 c-type cytochrome [Rhodospirillaceae bacterium]MBT5897868.1 c-type cytochrome [Rhodospirillaceae bacterium]MBT6431352.1 c-type cytochrome [Rhodospirillaceae bacterium]MBT7760399.1 c-type cytochrome [Rhodospirillaceae bacterium]